MQKNIYNDRLIGTSNCPSKTMWQIINNHTKKQQNMMKSTLLPDETNDYFVNVASNLLNNLKNNKHKYLVTSGISKPNKSFTFREVTYIEVRDIIKNIKK